MKDKLKEFVSENRESFEKKTLNPEVWSRIKQDMAKPERKVIPTFSSRWRYAAASVALFFVALSWLFLWKSSDEALPIVSLEHANPIEHHVVEEKQVYPDERSAVSTVAIDSRHQPTLLKQRVEEREPSSNEDLLDREALALLQDEMSASNRIKGILHIASQEVPSERNIGYLKDMLTHDPNTNVRMAAWEAYAKYIPHAELETQLQEVFVQQDDPGFQMELMYAMNKMDSIQIQKQTVEKLNQITEDPLSIDFLKQQAYATLMKTW